MHTLTALSDQFRRGLFLFLKIIFPKWVYDSGFSVGTSEGSNLRCSLTTEYTHKIPSPSNLQIRILHIGVFFCFSIPYTRREAKAMKKIIILLLVILLCGCSAEKPPKTLSSMQTESAETTVAEPACKCQWKSEPCAHEFLSHQRPRKSEPLRSRKFEPPC